MKSKMKKYILLSLMMTALLCKGQTISTLPSIFINDWNAINKSGFYDCRTAECLNTPDNATAYMRGINIAHCANQENRYLNSQIVFDENYNRNTPPVMYIRSTNGVGEGLWAKVLHNKGTQSIDGTLIAREVRVEITAGADHVFGESYDLRPLSEVEQFVRENKHLPEIPSEKQMQEEGLSINEFQIKLLQKIEELTLYTIELKKEVDQLKAQNKN